jgi:hypothetical protein
MTGRHPRPIGDIEVRPDDSLLYAVVFEPFPAIGVWALPDFSTARR